MNGVDQSSKTKRLTKSTAFKSTAKKRRLDTSRQINEESSTPGRQNYTNHDRATHSSDNHLMV